MRRLMTVMTVLASVAALLVPVGCGVAEAAGQTNSGSAAPCTSCRTDRSGIKVVGQSASGTTEIVGRPAADNVAQEKAAAGQPALRSLAEKRRWLREQAANGVEDRRQAQQLRAQIDRLTPQQVDVLTKAVLAQQLPAADQQQQVQQGLQQFDQQQQQLLQQANQELARAQYLRQALQNELWWRSAGYGVGYMPVITWLPEGTAFSAGATVSPDGRYVRTAINPFFSNVGPVYTYDLNTGRTQPWPPPSSYQTNNQPLGYPAFNHAEAYGNSWQQRQEPPQRQPRVWHDGIRTRVGNN